VARIHHREAVRPGRPARAVMAEPRPRILIVDDDATSANLLAQLCGDGYQVRVATDGEQALELVAEEVPDLVLLDIRLPGMDGLEVCARFRANPDTRDVAVIFITGVGDLAAEMRGLELGAVDYVTKPINPSVVRMRVRNQCHLKRTRDVLARMAITDGLTGIANRRHFDASLEREFARLARHGGELSLVMCDIDHFKAYNDAHGHLLGDQCLRAIAEAIGSILQRPADLVARFGGEEFACLLPETGTRGAAEVAARARLAIAGLGIPHGHSPVAAYVTASFGHATVRCRPGGSAHTLLARADSQLYLAKSLGRDGVSGDAGPVVDSAPW
jgi:diguanylate cyclase (GGDEF)-like protein